ncbi:hypothetical protein DWF00_27970 [Bosea caraganae]|uniref:DUF2946 domain-containing protein n=2 Tax=Bosea caraganae TaxID=2763117 RepID=A0A370KYV6_9HYPH|nr:hypothetical protein DWE98_25585 [Bosea caraganae]RDJ21208.1 hypothetical protein DWF00_27970 [Bosea caraganae]
MPATAPMFARLRRSVLGAWLASAYALAVLAAALAPTPALAAHSALDGAVLCSGQPAQDQNAPASDNSQQHCQGCPANPVVAAPPGALQPTDSRVAVLVAAPQLLAAGLPRVASFGLPQSRAPPIALS